MSWDLRYTGVCHDPQARRPQHARYPHPLVEAIRRWLPCQFFARWPLRRGLLRAPQRIVWGALLMAWSAEQTLAERFAAALELLAVLFPRWRRQGGYTGWAAAVQAWSAPLRPAVAGRLRREMRGRAGKHWRRGGRCAFAADGSRVECPRTVANEKAPYRAGRKGTGPQLFLTTLWHMGLGLPWDFRIGPGTAGERRHLEDMLPELPDDALVVADAGFSGYDLYRRLPGAKRSFLLRVGSYAHLALCQERGLHGLFRAHQRQIVSFRPGRRHGAKGRPTSRWLRRLGRRDQRVEYFKPKGRPEWMTAQQYAALPASIVVRELRYEVGRPGRRMRVVTLVTTLLDPQAYPAAELARLYGQRWGVETDLRHLKQTMKMEVLHCQTVAGVQKELAVFALVYNLVRRVMEEAGRRQRVEVDRVSFVDALRWLRAARPGDQLPALVVNPHRPGRVQPRVRKRRPKQYPLMTRPRAELRKALLKQRPAA